MSTKFKLGLPVALMALAVSSYSFADRNDCCPQKCEPTAREEAVPSIKPNCCEGPSLCHAYPTCIECWNTHLDIGFLYEQFRITQTDFGYRSNTNPQILPDTAHIMRPTFKLNWGITASLGYYLEHDHWFALATLDWLAATGKQSWYSSWNENIVPTGIWKTDMISGDDFVYCSDVKNQFKVNYFMLQVDLNRASYISNMLAVEPHFGLRTTWFFFHDKTQFTGGPLTTNIVYHDQKTNYWGIGPVWGLDTKWTLCQGISFYADNNLAILFGRTCDKDEVRLGDGCNCTNYQTFGNNKWQIMSPVAQVVIGFQYDRCVCDGTQNITIKAGMDTTYYWNQWNHIKVYNEVINPTFHSADDASVSLVGLRVELGWDF